MGRRVGQPGAVGRLAGIQIQVQVPVKVCEQAGHAARAHHENPIVTVPGGGVPYRDVADAVGVMVTAEIVTEMNAVEVVLVRGGVGNHVAATFCPDSVIRGVVAGGDVIDQVATAAHKDPGLAGIRTG